MARGHALQLGEGGRASVVVQGEAAMLHADAALRALTAAAVWPAA
jgi:hypothetical protein